MIIQPRDLVDTRLMKPPWSMFFGDWQAVIATCAGVACALGGSQLDWRGTELRSGRTAAKQRLLVGTADAIESGTGIDVLPAFMVCVSGFTGYSVVIVLSIMLFGVPGEQPLTHREKELGKIIFSKTATEAEKDAASREWQEITQQSSSTQNAA